jgi:hypothetical protein
MMKKIFNNIQPFNFIENENENENESKNNSFILSFYYLESDLAKPSACFL